MPTENGTFYCFSLVQINIFNFTGQRTGRKNENKNDEDISKGEFENIKNYSYDEYNMV